MLVRQQAAQAYAPVRRLRTHIGASGPALARRITGPLGQLAASAHRIQDGDPHDIAPGPGGHDEIATLSAAVNLLVANCNGQRRERARLNGTLEQRVPGGTLKLSDAFAAVQASGARIRAIVEVSQNAFIGTGPDGRMVDWNFHAEALLAWERAQVPGRTLGELFLADRFRPSPSDSPRAFAAAGFQGIPERRRERVVTDRNGKTIPVEMTTCATGADQQRCFSIFFARHHRAQTGRAAEKRRARDCLARTAHAAHVAAGIAGVDGRGHAGRWRPTCTN